MNWRRIFLPLSKMRDLTLKYDCNPKISCNLWCVGFGSFFYGICFGHAFTKTCQFATINDKVYIALYVSIKVAQGYLQKCITWPKKSRKGRQEWNKTCVNYGLPLRKLNALVKQCKLFIFLRKFMFTFFCNSCQT
jgi:hypothetical protein